MSRILNFSHSLQRLHVYVTRNLFISNGILQKQFQNATENSRTKKKTIPTQKITLISPNQSISITSLEEAQKLAKRRDLQLIKEKQMDTKTQRPVYKLVTAAEILSMEMPRTATKQVEKDCQIKSEKSLTIGSRISEHDLCSRLKNISKWLNKSHEVRILVQGSANESSAREVIFKAIEKSVTEPQVIGKIVQKQSKGSFLKFNILPILKKSETEDTSSGGQKV